LGGGVKEMIIYRNIVELINFVPSYFDEGRKSRIISVDGVDDSGKSYLASVLSRKYDYKRNIDDVLAKKKEDLEKFEEISASIEGRPSETNDSTEDFSDEIIKYHYEYKPDVNADIVFERAVNK
jgi:hypothetical protein